MKIKYKNNIILFCFIIIFVISSYFIYYYKILNSYQVYIDNKVICNIKEKKDFYLSYNKIVRELKRRFNVISVKNDIKFKRVKADLKDIDGYENIKDSIINSDLIKVSSVLVKSDGKNIGLVANKNEIKEMLDYIKNYYIVKNNIKDIKEIKLNNKITYINKETDVSKINNVKEICSKIIKENEKKPLICFKIQGIIEEEKSIYPDTVIECSNQFSRGESKIRSLGSEGSKIISKEVFLQNNKIINENIYNEKILKYPKNKIIVKGTKNKLIQSAFLYVPYKGKITSKFGKRWGKMHKGVDIAGCTGESVYSALDGKVEYAGWQKGYGNVIKIFHKNNLQTVYAHCNSINVRQGQIVKKGENIGSIGSTGRSTGSHLHFEVRIDGKAVNPEKYFKN